MGWDNSSKTKIQKYIEDTSEEIARLTKELNRAVNALKNRVEYEYCEVLSTTSEEKEIEVGDVVEITNNHGGMKGKNAYVIKVTDKFVTLELVDQSFKTGTFRKKKTNVIIRA